MLVELTDDKIGLIIEAFDIVEQAEHSENGEVRK